MSIVSSDLVQYASANMPADDSSTSGGAIDSTRRIDYTQITSAEHIDIVSGNAGDTTQTVTITGRAADGSLTSEVLTLNGTATVNGAVTHERILRVELSATCAGIVTIKGHTSSTVFRTIPVGERGFMAIFRQTASNPSTTVQNYCKFFWKNTNGSLALTVASVLENADPSSVITHALDASVGASTSVANRTTTPGFTFDGTAKTVPGTGAAIASGSAIGVWLNLTLAAGNAALRSTYTSEIDGQTT